MSICTHFVNEKKQDRIETKKRVSGNVLLRDHYKMGLQINKSKQWWTEDNFIKHKLRGTVVV